MADFSFNSEFFQKLHAQHGWYKKLGFNSDEELKWPVMNIHMCQEFKNKNLERKKTSI